MESTQLKSYAFESKFAGVAIEQGALVELSAGAAPGAWQLISRRVEQDLQQDASCVLGVCSDVWAATGEYFVSFCALC